MMNFFKKEYKERLKEVHSDDFIDQFIVITDEEDPENSVELDVKSLIDAAFQKGWEAYRASVLEASYLEK